MSLLVYVVCKTLINSIMRESGKYRIHLVGDEIVIIPLFTPKDDQRGKHLIELRKEISTKVKNKLSKASCRKINRIVAGWSLCLQNYTKGCEQLGWKSDRRMTFLTLTLAEEQKHDDYFIKRNLLSYFLQQISIKYNAHNYIWVAEKEKNNRIHFHIILDQYIHKASIQSIWNKIQHEHGYKTVELRDGKLWRAPSTQVKRVNDSVAAIKYMMKYISKSKSDSHIKGRLWGRSDSLREMTNIAIELNHEEYIGLMQNVPFHPEDCYVDDWFTIVKTSDEMRFILESSNIANALNEKIIKQSIEIGLIPIKSMSEEKEITPEKEKKEAPTLFDHDEAFLADKNNRNNDIEHYI